jgi:predicted MPP superfamily phosphohydrolase
MAQPQRRRRNLGRIRAMVLSVVGGVQIPGVAFLAHHIGWPIAVGGAAALSAPFLFQLRRPFDDRPKPPLLLYGALYPFFAWWVACLVFALVSPLVWLAARASGLPSDGALGISGVLALFAGVVATRREPGIERVTVEIADLPDALDGYRIAQISDIHCGSYTPASRVAGWVARMNALGADLIAVTGDLITTGDRHLEEIARTLGALSARDGVYACMGNHDYFCDSDRLIALLESNGIRVLRNNGMNVPSARNNGMNVPSATLHVAGVDDTWTGRADVARALAGRTDGVPTLLLAHDPNLFADAAAHGVELTLSGHTHGGQLALSRKWTLARLITEYTAGLFRVGESQLYVSRGAGTTGPPVRLGAPAELTLITLRTAA